jgi:nucleotide-binding universal stress UspA family protein
MKNERLLIALDLSGTATAAARYAAEYFQPDGEIVLLHAIELPPRPKFAGDKLPPNDALEALARERASERLPEIAQAIGRPDARIEIRVGKPHEVVVSAAIELGADTIVIGPHADRSHVSRFLGTTADRIVRTSPVPVLVATAPTAHAPRKLLVPVDEDSLAPTILEWARVLADRFDAEVSLLHVWSAAVYSHVASMSYVQRRPDGDPHAALEQELQATAEQWLEALARTGIPRHRVTSTVAWGQVGDVVIETARAQRAELIIVGRDRTGVLSTTLLGSTALSVLHAARCPVLVVTPPQG